MSGGGGGGGRRAAKSGGSAVEPRGAGGRRASLPYRNVVDLAKALCKTCRQRRASYAAGVVIALPGIIQTLQPEDPGPSAPRGAGQSRSPAGDQGGGRAAMGPSAPEARQSATSLASSASSASSNDSSGARDEGRHGGGSSASTGAMVQREDILVLTHDVRAFKEALGRLRKAFAPEAHEKQRRETRLVAAHERLGQVLRILRSILEKYPPIQSAELLVAASALIQRVKGHDYGPGGSSSSQACFEAVDHLALAFSSRVSEYLMGDLDTGSTSAIGKARSCENLLSPDKQAPTSRSYASPMTLTGPEADAKLMRIDDGVEFALRRAKVWSKYAKDVISYVEKRANLEAEHARNLLKLAQTMRPVLKEESFLPFQSIYCTAIDQDLDNANNCLSNCTLLHDHKFVEPLSARRNEHEKARKQLKEAWQRELKRMQELEANVRKARALYVQRHQEHDKAAQRADGDERRRRVEEEALQKAREAETTYKACVVEANERIVALERTKAEVLQQVRELMCQCDQTMKAVTVAYFQLQHTVTAPAPIQFQTLCESSRLYEPGSQYLEFVRRIPSGRHPAELKLLAFEPCAGDTRTESRRVHEAELEPLDQAALEARLSSEAAASRPAGWAGGTSDSDGSNRSGDTSPAASPQAMARTMLLTVSSGDELDTDHDNERGAGRPMCLSLAAETHSFRKLRTPSRCRECDSYVYFQGVECSECGLSSHKKCLETLAIRCGHKRLPRKMTTFGVELGGQPADEVPYIVRRCIAEMDARGYGVRGLYRVSGVKSKVERLCQCFENGATLVDLSDSPPHVVANVLKLYLRQLPEPLLTYRLYPHFIALAKEHPGGTGVTHHHSEEDEDELGEDENRDGDHHHDEEEEEAVVAALRSLVAQLPPLHARTLAALLRHLARVAAHSHLNQMPAGNLAIVFGPTLLRTRQGSASLSSLVDTVHQTRVIELLIMYVDRIFPDEVPHHEQVPEEHYTLLEAVTLRRCASEGDVESPLHDEATTQSQDSDDAAEPVVLASQLTGGTVHQWCSGGGSEDAESEASDEGSGLCQQPLANSGSSSSGGAERLGAPSSASEDAAEPAPVPPPRRAAARRVEARSCTRDTWSTSTMSTSSSSQQSAQSKACNMAELRRQFFEAPWGAASLEELAAAGARPSLLARHLLATPARTSSEPQLPANDESGGAGLSSSGASRQTTTAHVAEARRRVHSPLRESVSLKKHWFSTDEASSSSSSSCGGGGGGDAGTTAAATQPIASPQPGQPRHE
ncbi:rho GTPase-activating protein 45-like isoform X2 [Dermacentor silvarum]|uniref:rho GTPase-activating protein 45-like isoform X1 n=1 Tax=Dermacentor silvarum TaxID=543639 RepID=UPI00210150B5|nr:rho GTPase-activating protein 45-like isoform X1 [Dermacentor silvarum]XP_049514739.1 rho GTPase-activating protein 45-like isoform X2 [Dermacentor silvarum]